MNTLNMGNLAGKRMDIFASVEVVSTWQARHLSFLGQTRWLVIGNVRRNLTAASRNLHHNHRLTLTEDTQGTFWVAGRFRCRLMGGRMAEQDADNHILDRTRMVECSGSANYCISSCATDEEMLSAPMGFTWAWS